MIYSTSSRASRKPKTPKSLKCSSGSVSQPIDCPYTSLLILEARWTPSADYTNPPRPPSRPNPPYGEESARGSRPGCGEHGGQGVQGFLRLAPVQQGFVSRGRCTRVDLSALPLPRSARSLRSYPSCSSLISPSPRRLGPAQEQRRRSAIRCRRTFLAYHFQQG